MARPAVLAGAAAAAVGSLNESVVTLFLATPGTETLPAVAWPQLRYAASPLVAVACCLNAAAAVLAAAVLAQLLPEGAMNLWRAREAVGWVRGPGGRVVLGRQGDADRPLAGFGHGDFAALLGRFVSPDGLVAYADWKRDAVAVRALDAYLERLGRVDLAAPAGRADRLAFWVNAYNAAVLAGVLRDYPAGCGCRRRGWVGFDRFRDVRLWAGGGRSSLDRIEHAVVRPMGEPLAHFALVCGARGCPPLRAYTAAGFEEEVAANARRFLARPDAFRADTAARTVRLTRLLKWYGRDFARTPAGVVRALRPHLPEGVDPGWLTAGPVRVCFLPYDWTLNDRAPFCRTGP